MADKDTRIVVPEGEILSAIKNDGSTDTRIKIPQGELLDAIKASSGGGGTPPDLSSYEKKADHLTDITDLQNTKQDKGEYALKTDLPDISGKADKSYVDIQDTTTLNNAKVYTNQQVKVPNDKNTEQDTRLTNDEAILNSKADKSYVDDSDSSIRTQHSSDFTLLQNQVGSKTDKSYVDTADAKKQDKLTAQTLLAFFEAGDGITIALDGSKIKISKAA